MQRGTSTRRSQSSVTALVSYQDIHDTPESGSDPSLVNEHNFEQIIWLHLVTGPVGRTVSLLSEGHASNFADSTLDLAEGQDFSLSQSWTTSIKTLQNSACIIHWKRTDPIDL